MTTSITFTGLGSGIDLAGILDAQLEAERLRFVQPYEDWQTEWSDKVSAFQTLNTKLASLHSTVKSLDTENEFLVKTTTSSDTDVLTATADSSAVNDSITVVVNQLAQAEKEIHDGLSGEDAVVQSGSSGNFDYTYAGTSRSITIPDGTTLSELVTYINNDSQNPGVTASILNDGSGGATAYHLVLSGNSTGSDNTISVDASTSMTNIADTEFTESQSAQNSQVRIDGYPSASWIERSSNTVTDAVSGVSVSLADTGTSTITITSDTAAIKTKIQEFVAAFNDVRSYVREQTSYDPDTDKSGILLGNYAVDTIKNRLNQIAAESPSGFRSGYDTYMTLMDIGISTDVDDGSETEGQLVIDESDLNDALSENPDAVADLFSAYFSGRSASSSLQYGGYIDGITEPGTYEIDFDSSDPTQSRIRRSGGTWHSVIWDAGDSTLTGTSGTPEAGLVVKITDTGSDFTGEIDLKRGLSGDLKDELDFLTNTSSGPLAVLEENYQDIIDNIQDKIDFEENRITILEQRLRERYARLEQTLSELNGQSSYISQRLSQLS